MALSTPIFLLFRRSRSHTEKKKKEKKKMGGKKRKPKMMASHPSDSPTRGGKEGISEEKGRKRIKKGKENEKREKRCHFHSHKNKM